MRERLEDHIEEVVEEVDRISEQAPFRIERREDVAILWFDVPGEKVNTLKAGFEKDFDRVFARMEKEKGLKGLVFASAKPGSFIAGADIGLLYPIETAGEAARLSRTAQMVMNWIEGFRLPVIAAIHGACLGGGLELALACTGRVASHADETELGQLEVNLGVIPAAGGTQRLPRVVGIEKALELILTGKKISAKKAESIGLVDEAVHPSILIDAAIEHVRRQAKDGDRKRRGFDPKALLLESNPVGRRVLFDQARERTLSRTHGNLPAPMKAIDVIQTGVEEGKSKGLEAEAEAFGELVVAPQAKRLMELFFAREELKKESGVEDPDVSPRRVRKVGVLGAGLMGSGIAYVTAAIADIPVRLRDIDYDPLREGLRSISDMVEKGIRNDYLTQREGEKVIARIHPTTDYSGFQRVDVAIEAVFEDLDLKHQVLQQTEEHGTQDMIFASNTSSLPISDIAEVSRRPEQVIGMHYFSPVHKIPLCEIVVTERTAPWVIATCVELGKQQGKTVITVNDGPGLYTTRILGPYMNEAAYLLLEGVPIDTIDRALVDYGFPMGPLELMDEVGIEVVDKVSHVLYDAFGQRMSPPEGFDQLTGAGLLGQKSGKGFYTYGKDGKQVNEKVYQILGVQPEKEMETQKIAQRCALQMMNEAAYCYGEGILQSARDGDVGAIFGMGFPPFLGGPLRHIDVQGPEQILEQLRELQAEHGGRFTPAPVLLTMVEQDTGFYAQDSPPPGASS